ncbi:MAG TPA: molecular chaperone DjlA [Pseudomonas xinjiangensis]|uniref:Molecular chaperone DjlA n=2 Tax=root TaxID=1 RepID=A0A7V1BLW3_9GAMM|nr:molecular chaperone DjlA [Halopseudomonas xinjiangensis]HEC46021.1 molecular chaperone DjlA [Halopseudomonas xinjiangensis]
MLWPVTLAGALIGGLAAGASGCILGVVLGHALDRHWNLRRWSDVPGRVREFAGRNHSYQTVLFMCLGRLAKAEGRVQPAHLQLARDIMQQYRLDEPVRLQAMHGFNRGKDASVRLKPLLKRLYRNEPARAAELMDCCWRMALVTGTLGTQSRQLLDEWSHLSGMARAEQQRMHQRHRNSRSSKAEHKPPAVNHDLMQDAAELLGVDLSASPEVIKRAYRRQLSRHHPDKMTGASPQDLAAAGERVHAVQQAYERIRRYRGFR